MIEEGDKKPTLSAGGKRAAEIRLKRLADALRANLGRRKAQARERDASNDLPPTDNPADCSSQSAPSGSRARSA